ncbi:hypothetical protein [Lactobacillus sp. ESL0233]|nr:hypothetical protein [Lactobacillus sp. ESL0233]
MINFIEEQEIEKNIEKHTTSQPLSQLELTTIYNQYKGGQEKEEELEL